MKGRDGHRYACETEHDIDETCVVPRHMCPECAHPVASHVPGHECAGDIYEGGKVCPCTEYQ